MPKKKSLNIEVDKGLWQASGSVLRFKLIFFKLSNNFSSVTNWQSKIHYYKFKLGKMHNFPVNLVGYT
jgi:hypothetical protein